MVRWWLHAWVFLFLRLSACLCPTLFFSSSIHVTNDKVQHSCPYIDLCSVWSGWDWEDGAHAQTQRVRLHWVLRHLGALGNVNMFKALYLKCLTWKCCHNLWPRCSINSLCRNVKRRVWFLLLSYIWRRDYRHKMLFFFKEEYQIWLGNSSKLQ